MGGCQAGRVCHGGICTCTLGLYGPSVESKVTLTNMYLSLPTPGVNLQKGLRLTFIAVLGAMIVPGRFATLHILPNLTER